VSGTLLPWGPVNDDQLSHRATRHGPAEHRNAQTAHRAASRALECGARIAGSLRPGRLSVHAFASHGRGSDASASANSPERGGESHQCSSRDIRRGHARGRCQTSDWTAKSGGTLRLGMSGDVSTLDGHNTTPAQYDTTWSVFDRLIAYDTSLQPQPQLAESWDLSADSKQIKLNLRKMVQWHSGREYTSDDARYNLLRVRDAKLQIPTLRNQSNWFTSIDTPDKYPVVLTSDLPRPAILDFFELFNQVDKDTMEGPTPRPPRLTPARSSSSSGSRVTISRLSRTRTIGRPAAHTLTATNRTQRNER
jgi:Bacterial extracellular solute-binding proteins, family 5 Middle